MRRFAVILLICLILGAIAQTLVAWGCALGIEPVFVGETESSSQSEVIMYVTAGGSGLADANPSEMRFSELMMVPDYHIYHFRGFGVSHDTTVHFSANGTDHDIRSSGWPWRSVANTLLNASPTYPPIAQSAPLVYPSDFPPSPGAPLDHPPIPLAILPFGFMANTALYGFALFVLFLAHRRVVMIIRARRNRCTSCNYDLREIASDRCPECGATRAVSRAFPT